MKKKRLFLITGLVLALSLTGCGSSEKTAETTASDAENDRITGYLIDQADQYVTLGAYKGISVEKPIYEVSEDELRTEIDNHLYELSELKEVTRAADLGDILTVDLQATIEGESSPCLEENEYAVELGYEEFGAAFDEALTGAGTGDTVSVSCSFQEEDGYEDWAGKTLNFTVSVKKVEELVTPEYDEAFVKTLGYETVEEYEAEITKDLTAAYEEQSLSEARYNALLAAVEECQFDGYPDKLYDSCAASVEEQYDFFAEASGMSREELFEAFDMTQEDLDNEILESVNIRLFISALCQEEDLSVTEEEYNSFLEEQYLQYGYEDAASFEAEYGKEYILWTLYEQKVSAFLLDNASVEEIAYSYEGEDYEEANDFGEELPSLEEVEEVEEDAS